MKDKGRNSGRRESLARYAALALAGGASEAKLIPAQRVVTAEWVRAKCQFGCGGYNKRLCCPPFTPTPETTRRLLSGYRRALIFTYRTSGTRGRLQQRRMQRFLAGLERTIFLDGYYRALALGAGPCRLCPDCDPDGRCRFPELGRPAMEACGIDVYATCRNAGIELHVVTRRTQAAKHVNLILIE